MCKICFLSWYCLLEFERKKNIGVPSFYRERVCPQAARAPTYIATSQTTRMTMDRDDLRSSGLHCLFTTAFTAETLPGNNFISLPHTRSTCFMGFASLSECPNAGHNGILLCSCLCLHNSQARLSSVQITINVKLSLPQAMGVNMFVRRRGPNFF
jgi:hypothetical protein